MPKQNPRGRRISDWKGAATIAHEQITGRSVRLVPLHPNHAPALHSSFTADPTGQLWDYMAYGPFADVSAYGAWVREALADDATRFWSIGGPAEVDNAFEPAGVAALLRIDQAHGRAEIGHICLGPKLQRTRAATEALFLLIDSVFGAGYRRCEWKCDALNGPSRRAALRLGFLYEGLFADDRVTKGRNRDTAWYAITADRWPALQQGYNAWLATDNFDENGQQRRALWQCLGAKRPPIPPARVYLETERLVLRVAMPEDAEAIAHFYRDNAEHLAQWEPIRPADFTTTAYQRRRIEQSHDDWMCDRAAHLLMTDKQSLGVVGMVNLTNIIRGSLQQCFLGYLLGAAHVGRGLMHEALSTAIPWAFRELQLHRITAKYMPRNHRSAAVLERLGFVQEGRKAAYLKIAGKWEDHICCSLIAPGEV